MFLHNFKYEFINTIRQKELVFWMMCFPIILGTFFQIAFGDLYEKESMFQKIPVAVVEVKSDDTFKTVISELSSGDSPLFKAQYTDEKKALSLLETGEISGIIYVHENITLSVSGKGIEQTIIKTFLEQYQTQKVIITDIATNNPAQMQSAINALSEEINSNQNIALSKNKVDPYSHYFHNLIAMVALFGAMSGLHVATANQGNLSPVGARKSVSPTPKIKLIVSHLLAAYLTQLICVIISITYILFVLKGDMGSKIGFIYLSGAVGALVGVTLGFFIGAIGKMSEAIKTAIALMISMVSCFLSGLMVGNMKGVIALYCPIINKINPAAVISDLFYCLSIYDDFSRYISNIIVLLIMSVIFTTGGFLLTRGRKYASI